MGKLVSIGKNTVGSGRKMKVELHNYGRSTHDMTKTLKTTMSAGTLVPTYVQVVTPGDRWEIDIYKDVLTHPTIGPLFGSYRVQTDVYFVPIRLYIPDLMLNLNKKGLDMQSVKIPQVAMWSNPVDITKPIDNQQVNPSSIWSYLGIRGLGRDLTDPTIEVNRRFNALPYLMYWDIYNQYYANLQEDEGAVIHKDPEGNTITITEAKLEPVTPMGTMFIPLDDTPPFTYTDAIINAGTTLTILATGITAALEPSSIKLAIEKTSGVEEVIAVTDLFREVLVQPEANRVICSAPYHYIPLTPIGFGGCYQDASDIDPNNIEPVVVRFPLDNINEMKKLIMRDSDWSTEFVITKDSLAPYGLALDQTVTDPYTRNVYSQTFSQEGLGVKTYQNDRNQNWIRTEFIEGINDATAIDIVDDKFTLDAFNVASKLYKMLNDIAVSDGSYKSWMQSVYNVEMQTAIQGPMYLGGKIQNLVFQEVVSNSAAAEQPLGTLAGRGRMGPNSKGGKVRVEADELGYIMAITSITPNIDYSQGNDWPVNLLTVDDFHKPPLDAIGFQQKITDEMAWFDTTVTGARPNFKSAGFQPSWTNYMSNLDEVKGNFAEQNQQMFMVLTRRYEPYIVGGEISIRDLTTYIDPVKFNYIFADTRRDAQNFWLQIGFNATVRRVMSAKQMPNI